MCKAHVCHKAPQQTEIKKINLTTGVKDKVVYLFFILKMGSNENTSSLIFFAV